MAGCYLSHEAGSSALDECELFRDAVATGLMHQCGFSPVEADEEARRIIDFCELPGLMVHDVGLDGFHTECIPGTQAATCAELRGSRLPPECTVFDMVHPGP